MSRERAVREAFAVDLYQKIDHAVSLRYLRFFVIRVITCGVITCTTASVRAESKEGEKLSGETIDTCHGAKGHPPECLLDRPAVDDGVEGREAAAVCGGEEPAILEEGVV